MTQQYEIQQLQERLCQKEQLLLGSRAGLAQAMIDHFGPEAEDVIKDFVNTGTHAWAASMAKADRQANKPNDIQGILDFLWKPLPLEGFEFTTEQTADGYQMHVTRCPIAEMAKALKLEKWGFIFYCMGDAAICEGYNPAIRFTRTKTLMEGAEYCNHRYSYSREGE